MSFISSVASSSIFATTIATSTSTSLRPFANLDLSEEQRTQIRSIFAQAKSQGLSQAQVQQQIDAILTPAQQATLKSDIAQVHSQPPGAPPAQGQPPNPFADPNGPFANLDLSADQQKSIAQILQTAGSQGLTPAQVNAQVSAVLTTAQQATFQTDLKNLPAPPQAAAATTSTNEQTAQTQASGRLFQGGDFSSASSNSTTSQATLANGVTETDIRNQVAAATSLILNQLQSEVAG